MKDNIKSKIATISSDKLIMLWSALGFPGITKFSTFLRNRGIHINNEQLKSTIESVFSYQLHKSQYNKIRSKIVANYPYEFVQIDLLDMHQFFRTNQGNRWILIAIDIFTRKSFAQPIKTKRSVEVAPAMEHIIKEIGSEITNIESDDGPEFRGVFKNLMQKYNINHQVFTNDHHTLGVINGFSRTIKNMIYNDFTFRNSTNWIDHLQSFVKAYNHRPHQALNNLSPIESFKHLSEVWDINNLKSKIQPHHNYNVGDTVRIRVDKGTFSKGYTPIWSQTTHKIAKIMNSNAILDNDVRVRLENLQKVPINSPSTQDQSQLAQATSDEKMARSRKREGIFDTDEELYTKHVKGMGLIYYYFINDIV